MHREGSVILLDPDEQCVLRLPGAIRASAAPGVYHNLGVLITSAVSVQEILAEHRPSKIPADEWSARTADIDERVEMMERSREQLGMLAAKEIAAAGIDEAIDRMGVGDLVSLDRLHQE